MIDPELVVQAARSHIGTRYRDRSAERGRSVCCFGLLELVAADVGAKCPRIVDFDRPSLDEIISQAPQWFEVLPGIRRGCVALIAPGRLTIRRPLLHWGIVTDEARFRPTGYVHSAKPFGGVREAPWTKALHKRTHAFLAFREAA